MTTAHAGLEELREAAGGVPDPELPVISLAELGVLRAVRHGANGAVEVDLTPTYTGCPALETMREDVTRALRERGVTEVRVHTVLAPPWSTDDITAEGRRKLAAYGIAPPRARDRSGPVPLSLGPTRHRDSGTGAEAAVDPVRCPQCGSADTTLLNRFSSSACLSLRRCEACREPFDHLKEL